MRPGRDVSSEPHAIGTSLWLMPEGEAYDRLSAMMNRLATRLRTAPFAPHVTLLSGLVAPEPAIVESARALAGELGPLRLAFTAVDGTERYFRCLFLRVSDSDALRDAHARAARCFGREPDPSFDPHLSLVYGTLAAPVKGALADELAPEALASFEIRRLHVWRTDGPVGEWRALRSFAFGDDV